MTDIAFKTFPTECPRRDDQQCAIVRHGFKDQMIWVSSAGCRRLCRQRYACNTHDCHWLAPHGAAAASADCTVVGDIIGHFLVSGDFWATAWQLFQDTECFRAVERQLRSCTAASLRQAVCEHMEENPLSEAEKLLVHAAVSTFCSQTPESQTIKAWFMTWFDRVALPAVLPLAAQLCCGYGGVLNIDFSASDARQLRPRRRRGGGRAALTPPQAAPGDTPTAARSGQGAPPSAAGPSSPSHSRPQAAAPSAAGPSGQIPTAAGAPSAAGPSGQPARQAAAAAAVAAESPGGRVMQTWGAITGTEDVPLLPCLFTPQENRLAKEKLILLCFALMRRLNLRPAGINTDDLAADFPMLVSCLESSLPPGTVVFESAENAPAADALEAGKIVVDTEGSEVMGFNLGQDALHVYHRLLETLNKRSPDAAFAVKCLRKWLGSVNPATRLGGAELEHPGLFKGRGGPLWPPASPSRAEDWRDALRAYFSCEPVPANSFDLLAAAAQEPWRQAETGPPLPLAAKAVILDDVAQSTGPPAWSRHRCAMFSYEFTYGRTGHPTRESIANDLEHLATLFSNPIFDGGSSGSPAFFLAQAAYLKRVRIRPAGPRGRARARARPRAHAAGEPPSAAGRARASSSSRSGSSSSTSGASSSTSGSSSSSSGESDVEEQPTDAASRRIAGGTAFTKAASTQCERVTVNGVLASYRSKWWATAHGMEVSLGTVGAERLWRNLQRCARNKGRAVADYDTVSLLSVMRWLTQVSMRLSSSRHRATSARRQARAYRAQDNSLHAEWLALAFLGQDAAQTPLLGRAGTSGAPMAQAEDVGLLHALFRRGSL